MPTPEWIADAVVQSYLECAYTPMVELLDYLTANGFTTYIASGGGRDFMRPVSQEMYSVSRERVIGNSYTAGAEQALNQAEADGWTVVSIKKDWTTVFPS